MYSKVMYFFVPPVKSVSVVGYVPGPPPFHGTHVFVRTYVASTGYLTGCDPFPSDTSPSRYTPPDL